MCFAFVRCSQSCLDALVNLFAMHGNIFGSIKDPLGYQWASAKNILLTKRGEAFKPV